MNLSEKINIKIKRAERDIRHFLRPPLLNRFFKAAWEEILALYRARYRSLTTRKLKRRRGHHQHPINQFARRQVKYAFLIGTIGAFSRRGYSFHTHKDKKHNAR